MKKVTWLLMSLIVFTPVTAGETDVRDSLATLVVELQRVRALSMQYSKVDQGQGRYRFRYDLVDKQIAEIVAGIETHLSVINSVPNVERLRIAQ